MVDTKAFQEGDWIRFKNYPFRCFFVVSAGSQSYTLRGRFTELNATEQRKISRIKAEKYFILYRRRKPVILW